MPGLAGMDRAAAESRGGSADHIAFLEAFICRAHRPQRCRNDFVS
jgi:hypothetical protein